MDSLLQPDKSAKVVIVREIILLTLFWLLSTIILVACVAIADGDGTDDSLPTTPTIGIPG